MIEFETKVLDIQSDDIISLLEKLGAVKQGDYFMKRWMYQINNSEHKWLRLRNDGIKSVLTYKYGKTSEIGGVEEIETIVEDFENTHKILSQLNFDQIIYQENKRISYLYKDIEFDIDTWPMIPTFLEVESKSVDKVLEGLKLIGLEGKDIGNIGTVEVYKKYNLNLHDYKELNFL